MVLPRGFYIKNYKEVDILQPHLAFQIILLGVLKVRKKFLPIKYPDYFSKCKTSCMLESTKMLVGGGLMPDGGISGFMEVLDTENPNMVCQPIPNYPLPIQNPIYGLLNDNKTILVCTAFSHAQCMKLTPTNWVTSKYLKNGILVLGVWKTYLIFSPDSSRSFK